MTKFIGNLKKISTVGEKKVYNYIEKAFEEERGTFCYYNPIIGGKEPDFIIISPKFGVSIIEVKDYSEERIRKISETEDWKIISKEGQERRENPFIQLRNYWKATQRKIDNVKEFRRYPSLIQQVLVFPFLTRSSEAAERILSIGSVKTSILFKEDFSSIERFKSGFWKIMAGNYELSLENIDVLRSKLIITSILPSPTQPRIYDYFPTESILKVLDEEQEKFAYNLGEGHRLIFGVAGSGKTILLVARADLLARKYLNWRILILCYNRLLAKFLLKLINPNKYPTHIEILNFHKWAKELIISNNHPYSTEYNTKFQEAKRKDNMHDFFSKDVPRILSQVISQGLVREYDAILIDETQDFDKEWLKCIIKTLNPDTNSLLVTCDGLQGIYARKKFYWKEVGIKAPGRVTKFRNTYRNPSQIGETAFRFLVLDKELDKLIEKHDEFLEPKQFARKGGVLNFKVFKNEEEEYRSIQRIITKHMSEEQVILLLFHRDLQNINFDHRLVNLLDEQGVKWNNLKKTGLETKGLFIGTLQGTKGLEAAVVIIPELERIGSSTNKRQLIYVGMTRATHALYLTASGTNEFTSNLQNLQNILYLDPKILREIREGDRCYYCRENKYNGAKKPFCFSCWERLVNQEICYLCGNSLGMDYENNVLDKIKGNSFGFISCTSCDEESKEFCKLCGDEMTINVGKPICKKCYTTLRPAWAQASEKHYSKEIG